jgi:uncharacterized protein (TIGR02284 family)
VIGRKSDGAGLLNALLRGEIAAIETYEQALEKFRDTECAEAIRRLRDEHAEAADVLRKHIHHQGGNPARSSGAWGVFAKAVAGTAKLLGDVASIKALKEGEEQGAFDYENALKDLDLSAESKALIETTLLPQTKAHVPVLDQLLTVVRP